MNAIQDLSTLPLNRRIRAVRRRLGLTQAALAERVGCMQSAISMVENGRLEALSRATLEKIATELGFDLPADVVPEGVGGVCPNGDCPSMLPVRVGDEWLGLARGQREGRFCTLCGELLLDTCAGCGMPVHGGAACCGRCGRSYAVLTPPAGPDAAERWASERRTLAELLSRWAGA